MGEFFLVLVLPILILGVGLSALMALMWFIGERVKRFEKFKNITPEKMYQATIVVIIIIAIIYWAINGTGIENDGF